MIKKNKCESLDLRCPRDQGSLLGREFTLICPICARSYPMVDGVPVLIDDNNSVFAVSDYIRKRDYRGVHVERKRGLRGIYQKIFYKLRESGVLICSLTAEDAVRRILEEFPQGKILVTGSGDSDYNDDRIIYTDVTFGGNVEIICDAHSIPFPDRYFSGVIIVAVMEHVINPWKCSDEIRRVLISGGLVYCSTPFLQPVHMGAHDFTRFTYLGHRNLFRWFDDIESGPVLGPVTSVVYVMQYALLCISDRPSVRRIFRAFGILIGAALKPLDYIVRNRLGTYDCAGGFFSMGGCEMHRLVTAR